jgi:clan AA aspartic protease (TIGR02281 family)
MEKFKLERRKIIVTAKLKGPETEQFFDFILDTGAGTTVISEDTAILLGYDLAKVTKTETFVTAGSRVNAKMIQLHKMEVFGTLVSNFRVSVMPFPIQLLIDGLVGVDFLQKLKKLKIHFDTQEIEIN